MDLAGSIYEDCIEDFEENFVKDFVEIDYYNLFSWIQEFKLIE